MNEGTNKPTSERSAFRYTAVSLTDVLSDLLCRLFYQRSFLRDDLCWKCTQISLHIQICLLSKLSNCFLKLLSTRRFRY